MAGEGPPAPSRSIRWWQAVATAAVLAGVAARISAWWSAPSLWIDEAYLAVNFAERSWGALLREPLAYHQIAPPGFVLLERALVGVAGSSERTLRFVAASAGSLALVLFPHLARRVVSPPMVALSTVLFALSTPLMTLSNQVKPYALDVLAGVLLPLLVVRWIEAPDRVGARTGAWTTVAFSLLSFGAVFVTAGIAVALIIDRRKVRELPGADALARGMLLSLLVGIGAAASVASRETEEVLRYYRNFWRFAFPSRNGDLVETLSFPLRWAEALVRYLLSTEPGATAIVAVGVLVAGVVGLRARSLVGRISGWTATAAFVATAMRLYPTQERTGAVLGAPLLIGVAAIVELLVRGVAGSIRSKGARFGELLLAFGATAFLVAPSIRRFDPSSPLEDLRAVVRQLALQRETEVIYVVYSARPAWRYYAPRIAPELTGHGVVLGGCHRRALRPYLEEIDRLRPGGKAWIVFSHNSHTAAVRQEREVMERYLDSVGAVEKRLVPPARAKGRLDDAALLVAFRPLGAPDAPSASDAALPEPIARGSCLLFADEEHVVPHGAR